MKKIFSSLIIMIVFLVIMPVGVEAAGAVSMWVDCSEFKIDEANSARKYSECDINLTAPDGIVGTFTISLKYNNSNEYSDFEIVEKGNVYVGDITKTNSGGSIRFRPYGGQYGTFKVATIRKYGDANLSDEELAGTITIQDYLLQNPNESEEGRILLYDVCNKFKTNFARFYKSGKYIYSAYNFDLDDAYHPSTCGNLGAFKAKVDKTTIPEGLELVDGYMNSNDATMTFNKETGEFVIDFDELIMESEEVSNDNPPVHNPFGEFTIKYAITDSTSLKDSFDINIIDISYINLKNKDIQIYEDDDLLTIFTASNKGDWNGDGELNLVDLIAYRLYLAGFNMAIYYDMEITEGLIDLVDLNNDGIISISDIIMVRKILVGLPID